MPLSAPMACRGKVVPRRPRVSARTILGIVVSRSRRFVVPAPAAEAFPVGAFAFGGNSHAGLTRTALKGIT